MFYKCHVPASTWDIVVIDFDDRAYSILHNPYMYNVQKGYPPFRYLAGAKIELISDRDGMELLKSFLEEKIGDNTELKQLIEEITNLPF